MATVLVLNSSASGADSVSRQLVQSTVSRLRSQNPGLHIVERDLDSAPVPHLNAETTAAVRAGINGTPAQRDALALSNALVEELKAADTIVIGAPMYNFSVPTTLRAWFDHVLRAGETFRYTEQGPQGLLSGKKVIVVESRGGLYSEGAATAFDFQEPYLRHLLGFIGLDDVTFVRAEKLGFGPEARAAAIASATEGVRAAAA